MGLANDGIAATSAATRVIPRGGLPAWSTPDPAAAPASRAAAGLEVRVVETTGAWAHVEFTNGWDAWVDGRALAPVGSDRAARRITALPGAGAVLIVLGSLLPWLTAGDASASAWKISVWTLLTHHPSTGSPRVGLLLLIPLIALVPYLTRTPFHPFVNVALGAIGAYSAMAGAFLTRSAPGPRPGIGLAVTALGGLAVGLDYFAAPRVR